MQIGASEDNSFWSVIRNIGQVGETIGTITRNVSPIWNPNPTTPVTPNPTSRVNPTDQGNTTGTSVSGGKVMEYMPWIIGGVAVIAAIYLLKK
jgi:hypothetical protein